MNFRAVALLAVIVIGCGGGRRESTAPAALYREGRTALWKGNFDRAEAIALHGAGTFTAQPEWRELFSILRAESVAWRKDGDTALHILDQTPVSGSREAAIRRLLARGYALTDKSRYGDAAEAYARAEKLAVGSDPALRAEISVLSITPQFREQDWSRMTSFARQAVERGRTAHHPFVVVAGLGMLGTAEMNTGDYQQALGHLTEAKVLARRNGATSLESLIVGNAGWCYMQLGDTDEALRGYTEAEDYAERHGVTRTQSTWLTNIANVYLARQQFEEALPYAERAVAAARRAGEQGKLATALGNLALVNLELGRLEAAAAANHEAMGLRKIYGKTSMPYSDLTEARIAAAGGAPGEALKTLGSIIAGAKNDEVLRWQAQAAAALAYRALGRLGEAARMYEAALESGDSARAQQKDDSYLFAFESNLIRFYDDYIDLLLATGRNADALRVAERSRARTLREGLGQRQRGAAPEPLFAPMELARANGATILCYWLAPRRSLLWTVTPDAISVARLPPAAAIERDVEAYRAELQSSRHSLASTLGASLYGMLVAPAPIASTRIIVVPDGRLNAINLETLIAPWPAPHYWIDDVTVSYTPSMQLLDASRAWRNDHDRRLLVLGDVPAEGQEFPALAHAGVEIAKVAGHFAASRRVVVTGARATPAAYIASTPRDFGFLHFVAHGTASSRSPLESSVILAPGANGFRLSGRDIVNVPLAAELVTVSSCNSAGRRSYTGEGLVGLAWAFMRAGARRVVAAQWEVSDSATPQIMDRMYAAIDSGLDPAAALRKAKLALLHSNSVYERPLYWAPFVIYGAS